MEQLGFTEVAEVVQLLSSQPSEVLECSKKQKVVSKVQRKTPWTDLFGDSKPHLFRCFFVETWYLHQKEVVKVSRGFQVAEGRF